MYLSVWVGLLAICVAASVAAAAASAASALQDILRVLIHSHPLDWRPPISSEWRCGLAKALHRQAFCKWQRHRENCQIFIYETHFLTISMGFEFQM